MSRDLSRTIPASETPEPAPVDTVIALGSNMGDSDDTIAAAVAAIRALPRTSDVRVSPVFHTTALSVDGPDPDRPVFSNVVAIIRTTLAPSILLTYLQRIEQEHGRVRHERWGDRTLDLDIIAYGDLEQDDPDLTIPHPRAHERSFVLEPWLAVDPDATLPGHGRVAALLQGLPE